MRVGFGYDAHRFEQGRKLVLGGVLVPYAYGLKGHSDADVLVHALIDALLGAAALGDIGKWFPDTDQAYENADSLGLLVKVSEAIKENGFRISNIDLTVVAQKPKLAEFIPFMRQNLARVCALEYGRVSVKATTEEGMGFTGKMEGISCYAVCLIEKQGNEAGE